MSGRLEGKVVVITGAGSGQGRSGAILFAREGANLALCDVNESGLQETVELVAEENPKTEVLALRTDVTVLDEVAAFVKAITTKFEVIDVIYNNAGKIQFCSLEETSEDDWEKIHAINSKAPFFLVQQALPALKKSTSGSIVNTSSGTGLIAPSAGIAAYCSSKGAIIALTRALAQDLAPYNIRVNCVVPGLIDTPMSQGFYKEVPEDQREAARAETVSRGLSKRFGQPEEIAAVAVFLATSDASYINGAIIPVDDGFTAV